MRIKVLGSGSAFVLGKENYHSNFLIETGDTNLLFDAGSTIADALDLQGYTPEEIRNIFLTHNHDDHNGGMEYMGFKTYFGTFPFGQAKPNLFGYGATLEELWDHSLRGGMKSLQGSTSELSTYFNPTYLDDNGTFEIGDIGCKIIQTIHVIDDRRIVPTHGIMLYEDGNKVFITGDSQCAPNQMLTYYEEADHIFHDCEIAEYPNSVHAQYHELCKLPEHIKGKMYLYHFMEKDVMPDALADGFRGFVKRGADYTFGKYVEDK